MPKFIKKHFDNPFPDYSIDSAKNVVFNNEINEKSKVIACFGERWDNTLKRLNNLDFNDYSVYTGTSGIALLKLLRNSDDKANLLEVKKLLRLNHLKHHRHTFLCGDAGPLAIGAVVSHKLADDSDSQKLIHELLSFQEQILDSESGIANEYLYGRAGYWMFIEMWQKEAKEGKFKFPLMYQWHDSYYLGAAHGLSGIIYLLLQAHEYLTDSDLNTLIKPTIDCLSSVQYSGGNFPSSLGSETDRYVQWCHGAPGFLYMYSTAYKDVKHLYRAIRFAEWCVDYTKNHEEYPPDRPLSLFEGISGPMYLLLDIQKPLEAKFPGYTL
ncbi:lanc-like protein [Holotrichia oblita]|uniref:Lanc-like protein n=1 Tax=Holotrichia oblita TaxID=644536 RepID=A0ACB9T3Y3_HOLOL|nr:lanc-like protein [Holotrichia oblita]